MIVMTTISGIDAAPSDVTITGAMPVTRIVAREADDERAPPVRLAREPPALVLEDVRVGAARLVSCIHSLPLPAVRSAFRSQR